MRRSAIPAPPSRAPRTAQPPVQIGWALWKASVAWAKATVVTATVVIATVVTTSGCVRFSDRSYNSYPLGLGRWLSPNANAAAESANAAAESANAAAESGNAAARQAGGPNSEGASKGADAEAVRRAEYVKQRYRDEYDPLEKPKAEGFDVLKPTYIVAKTKDDLGYGPNTSVARATFIEAEGVYAQALASSGSEQNERFQKAAALYVYAAKNWPNSLLEEDARFLAGESYFFCDHYAAANAEYELLIKQHPNTRHMDVIDARRFTIAQYWLDVANRERLTFASVNLFDDRFPWRDTRGHAYRVFDKIRIDDPTGKLSDDATLAAANAYFAQGDFEKADQFYTDLRKTFPSSEHQFTAHFLGLKTKLLCYGGPDYSGDPLEQAEQLLKQTRRQFPKQAGEEEEYLKRVLAEIRFKKAERLWTMGRYHELRQEYRASAFYLDQVARDYNDTPFADDARQRVAAHAGDPPVPPQKLEWLVELFPKREIAKPLFSPDVVETSGKSR